MPESQDDLRLSAVDAHKSYSLPHAPFAAARRINSVAGVSLELRPGRRLALVGESGSGKSTLGRLLLDLERPTSGTIAFNGKPLSNLTRSERRTFRQSVQAVFQNPYTSLDPLVRIVDSVAEPLVANGWKRRVARERAAALLEEVDLPADSAGRYPRQFSGGQRQRIAIARALALNPQVLILDEPVSSLDSAAQRAVIELLDRQTKMARIGFLMITHDLSVIRGLVDEVLVMHLGIIKERGSAEAILNRPQDPYTQSLLAAIPPGNRTGSWPPASKVLR